jgi:hypothetical protein
VVDECYQSPVAPERSVQRDLVEILDDAVVVVTGERFQVVPAREKWKCVAATDTVYIDAIEGKPRRCTLPRAAEEIDLMPSRHYAAENLPEMELGTAGLGIFGVLPV